MRSDDYKLVRVELPDEWDAYHRIRREELFEARGRFGVYDENHPDEHVSGNVPLLLKFQGKCIGTTRLDIRENGSAVIRLVAVTKLEQGRGHGRELALQVQEFAMRNGTTKLLVNSAPDAFGYYKKLGYVRDDWDPSELLPASAKDCIQLSKLL